MKARGFALILVIWTLFLLTALAAGFIAAVRAETSATIHLTDEIKAEAALYAGLQYAIHNTFDADSGRRWARDAKPHTLTWGETSVEIRLREVNSRINPNLASLELLTGLFDRVLKGADAQGLAAAVVEYRERYSSDGNSAFQAPRSGAKNSRSHQPFQTLSQLGRVEGMRAEFIEQLAPYLSVHVPTRKVSASTAPEPLVSAVPGASANDAALFIDLRNRRTANAKRLSSRDLPGDANYFSHRGTEGLIYIETSLILDPGQKMTESTLIRIDPKSGNYQILSREILPGEY